MIRAFLNSDFRPAVFATHPRQIALTFDDGPNPSVTPRLLELLDRHSIRATFFLIGRFVAICPALTKDLVAHGHAVGNHTYSHPPLFRLTLQEVEEELVQCQRVIASAVGEAPMWMRPPFGGWGPHVRGAMLKAKLRGVAMWSVSCQDWIIKSSDQLVQRLVGKVGKSSCRGEVILLHDGDYRIQSGRREQILSALDHLIPRWLDAGYEFVTVNDFRMAHRANEGEAE
jgi:peptidoglycan/xylan/chitin deacetylase (PgdA/CDA1 family)